MTADGVDVSGTAEAWVPDPDQRAVLDSGDPALLVLGGPGTGRTDTALHLIASDVARGAVDAASCLVLSPTRRSAGVLRDRLSDLLLATVDRPLVRTPSSLAFALLRRHAALSGEPLPRLLSGAEQDVVLTELLEGHRSSGAGGTGTPGPSWPAAVLPALGTRAFRDELRDLLMRAVEQGLEAADLRRLGAEHAEPAWVAAADVMDEYDQVMALSAPGAHDAAWVVARAADLLESDPGTRATLAREVGLVVVDDAQELTAPAARMVRSLAESGARVVLLGDADVTVQAFRGADPGRFVRLADDLGARRLLLTHAHRQAGPAADAAELVRARIGAVHGTAHRSRRRPADGNPDTTLDVHVLAGAAQEGRFVAQALRRAHLREGVPWSDMAVIVRSARAAAALQRALTAGGVPHTETTRVTPLRDEPAARGLLDALEAVLALASPSGPDPLPGEPVPAPVTAGTRVGEALAGAVLTGPLCGADPVVLRGVRRAVRRDAAAVGSVGGGAEGTDPLARALEAAVAGTLDADRSEPALAPVHALADVLRAGIAAVGAPGATAEDVLWAIWDGGSLPGRWRAEALAGGAAGARADRALDAVLALMGSATAFTDRWPGSGPRAFLEHVLDQEVAADSLAGGAPRTDHVEVMTPQSAAGREWHTVVVAGLQEGVWPDLRLRGSLLGSERLSELLRGRAAAGDRSRAEQVRGVRHDETRQFHLALTRARRRVLLTAVLDETESPSPFLELLAPPGEDGGAGSGGEDWTLSRPGPDLTLRGVVGELRRTVVRAGQAGDHAARDEAARLLAVLAAAQVPGADPLGWAGSREDSSPGPVIPPGGRVRLSPSKVEGLQSCSLRWFLTTRGGETPGAFSAVRGTLVHDICSEHPDAPVEELHAELERRWVEAGLGDAWHTRREYERTRTMLTRFADYRRLAADEGWALADVERDVRLTLDLPPGEGAGRGPATAEITGRADRVETRDGAVRIVDLKTGKGAGSAESVRTHPQLGLYQVAVAEGAFPEGTRPGGGELVVLGSTNARLKTVSQEPLPPGEDTWAHALVREAAVRASGARFPATPGSECRTCPVRSSCPVEDPEIPPS